MLRMTCYANATVIDSRWPQVAHNALSRAQHRTVGTLANVSGAYAPENAHTRVRFIMICIVADSGQRQVCCRSLCASLTQAWSTVHMQAYAARLVVPWAPIAKTCPKLRKRKLSHMVSHSSSLCSANPATAATCPKGWSGALVHQVKIAQDNPDFHIDGYGVVRGDESDPTLGQLI